MSHYLFESTINGRAFNGASSISDSYLLSKRVKQSYHYFFFILGIRPINLIKNGAIKRNTPPGTLAKQSLFALSATFYQHYLHTALALLLLKVSDSASGSLKAYLRNTVEEYDSRDRREYFYFEQLFNKVGIPGWLAFLVGNKYSAEDVARFDQADITPLAASEDSFKRNFLFHLAATLTSIALNDFVATKIIPMNERQKEVYEVDSSSASRKLFRFGVQTLSGELGAFLGRAVYLKNGTAEYWGEFLAGILIPMFATAKLEAIVFGDRKTTQ